MTFNDEHDCHLDTPEGHCDHPSHKDRPEPEDDTNLDEEAKDALEFDQGRTR